MPRQSGVADLIVKGAIALVTAAFFIGAYLQFQVGFWLALIAALSVYITLIMLHALMRRSGTRRRARVGGQPPGGRGGAAENCAASGGWRAPRAAARVRPCRACQGHVGASGDAGCRAGAGRRRSRRLRRRPPRTFRCRRLAPPRAPRIFRDAPASASEREPSLMAHRPGAMSSDAATPRADVVGAVRACRGGAATRSAAARLVDAAGALRCARQSDARLLAWTKCQALAAGRPARRAAADASAAGRARDGSRCRARHDQASRRRGERRRRSARWAAAAASGKRAARVAQCAADDGQRHARHEEDGWSAGLGDAACWCAGAAAHHAVAHAPCFARRCGRRRPHRCDAVADRRPRGSPDPLLRGRRLSAR